MDVFVSMLSSSSDDPPHGVSGHAKVQEFVCSNALAWRSVRKTFQGLYEALQLVGQGAL